MYSKSLHVYQSQNDTQVHLFKIHMTCITITSCNNVAYRQTEIKWSFSVEHLNSWFAGTHESHENWYTTNKNEFTVYILQLFVEGKILFIQVRSSDCNKTYLWYIFSSCLCRVRSCSYKYVHQIVTKHTSDIYYPVVCGEWDLVHTSRWPFLKLPLQHWLHLCPGH
jgi:hypothetical protein